MSIRQTATDTLERNACSSTRSAIFFAVASKSMVGVFPQDRAWRPRPLFGLVRARGCSAAEPPQVVTQAIFCIAKLMKPLLEQRLDPVLRSRAPERSHASIPPSLDFDVRRQARGVDKAFRVRDRPLVERGDAGRDRVDKPVEFVIRQRPVHIAIGLSQVAPDVV